MYLLSIYILNFFPFYIYEKCLSLSLKEDFIISLQGEIFESTLKNVYACLITHKNSTIVDRRLEIRYAIPCAFSKRNIAFGIIDRTELTFSKELAFLMTRPEKNPNPFICIFLIIYTQAHLHLWGDENQHLFLLNSRRKGVLTPMQSMLNLFSDLHIH